MAPNDRHSSAPISPVTNVEFAGLLTALLQRVAELEGIDVSGDVTDVFVVSRGSVRAPRDLTVTVHLAPKFGSSGSDLLSLRLVRVTEPVTSDGSLVTSQSVPVDQTDDQADQTNEEN